MTKMNYVGRRVVKAGRLKHCFFEIGKGEDLNFYPKAKASRFLGAIIGTTYEFEDGLIPRVWADCKVGAVSDDHKLDWELEDRLSVEEHKQRNLDPSGELSEIIDRLRRFRVGLNRPSRATFDIWLIRELSK
ncbi:MAG: hypothetical protein ACRBBO_05915 [Cognatishimia sp.]